MKLKSLIGIIILLFTIIIGSILLVGMTSSDNFKLYYFIFIILIMLILVFSARVIFDKKYDIIYFIFIGILVCLSLTYFLANMKTYYEITPNTEQLENELKQAEEINAILEENYKYYNYIDYQNQLIEQTNQNIADLEEQVDESTSQYLVTNDNTIKQLQETLNTKDQAIATLQEQINQQNKIISDLETDLNNIESEYIYIYEDD